MGRLVLPGELYFSKLAVSCFTITNYKQKDNNLARYMQSNLFHCKQRETTWLELETTLCTISLKSLDSILLYAYLTTSKVLSFSLTKPPRDFFHSIALQATETNCKPDNRMPESHTNGKILSLVTCHAISLANLKQETETRITTTSTTE